MDDSDNRKHQTFTRMQGFGVAHTSDFAPTSLATQLFATLAGIVTRMDAHAATQVSSRGAAREGTTTRGQAREELRADLIAINRTARALAADVPGINDKFRVPPVGNDQALLNAARAAAVDAAPLQARFIALEMPADFLTDLNDDIARLEETMGKQSSGVGNAVAAKVAIEATVDQGVAVRDKLDAIMKNKYANDPATLAEWASASHIERAPRRKKAPATPGTGETNEPPTGS
ncbi:MAG: hypothetical protein H7Z16_08350 [Pyrinomonadaceae bacterium]|nr:hypothetical protein [Pyrinomonadaceae bacterium]